MQKLSNAKRRHLIAATLWTALPGFAVFVPFFWPAGPLTPRALLMLVLLLALSFACGFLFAVVTWRPLSKWLDH
jgi:hypothetical protein